MTGDHLKLLLVSLISITLGVGAGAALVVEVLSRQRQPPPQLTPSVIVQASPSGASAEDSLRELDRLQMRVSSLEQSARAGTQPAAAHEALQPTSNGDVESEGLGLEHDQEVAKRRQNEQLARFAEEATDPSWATATAQSFQADLDTLGGALKWSSAAVECRMSMCKGTMKWPSYEAASGSLMPLLLGHYKKNCATTVTLPEPSDRSAPYEGNVFFDCTQSRTQ